MGAGTSSMSISEASSDQVRDLIKSLGDIYISPADKLHDLLIDGKILSTFSLDQLEDLLDDIEVTKKTQRNVLLNHLSQLSKSSEKRSASPISGGPSLSSQKPSGNCCFHKLCILFVM